MPRFDAKGAGDGLPPAVSLAFRPLHKRAFGLAVGFTLGGCVFLATAFALVVPGYPGGLELLSHYLPGYAVSWRGAVAGALGAVFAAFVAAWFAAFCRNFFLAASIWMVRTRAELRATHDFLDHI